MNTRKSLSRLESEERKETKEAIDESLNELLSGKTLGEKIVWRNKGMIAFLVAIALFYIHNRNRIEAGYRAQAALMIKVDSLRYESLIVNLELMTLSSQAEVIRKVEEEGLGLEISKEPPIMIKP